MRNKLTNKMMMQRKKNFNSSLKKVFNSLQMRKKNNYMFFMLLREMNAKNS